MNDLGSSAGAERVGDERSRESKGAAAMTEAQRIVFAQLPGDGYGEIVPDDKDWTWVLQERCAACGFDPAAVNRDELARLLEDAHDRFAAALQRADVRQRPEPATWSPLEYVCHVRDVNYVIAERATSMLMQDDPVFQNWDQDVTAVAHRYNEQDPGQVAAELRDAFGRASDVFSSVRSDQWQRPGRRSNGSVFTVETLGQYFLHDLVHHLHDLAV
jgi:hypothetical protein